MAKKKKLSGVPSLFDRPIGCKSLSVHLVVGRDDRDRGSKASGNFQAVF